MDKIFELLKNLVIKYPTTAALWFMMLAIFGTYLYFLKDAGPGSGMGSMKVPVCVSGAVAFALGFIMMYVRRPDGITPDYIKQYQQDWEKRIVVRFPKERTEIPRHRSYRILQHIFEKQSFNKFLALDLTLPWWLELNDPESVGVSNESQQILDGVVVQFGMEGGCSNFKRLFVAYQSQVENPKSLAALRVIEKSESEIRGKKGEDSIQTKIMIFENATDNEKATIRSLCDIALWEGPGGFFALVDDSLIEPIKDNYKAGSNGRHKLCVCPHELKVMMRQFASLYGSDNSRRISDVLPKPPAAVS